MAVIVMATIKSVKSVSLYILSRGTFIGLLLLFSIHLVSAGIISNTGAESGVLSPWISGTTHATWGTVTVQNYGHDSSHCFRLKAAGGPASCWMTQNITIGTNDKNLTFWLNGTAGSVANGYACLYVYIDGHQVGSYCSFNTGSAWVQRTCNISTYSDGGKHQLQFYATEYSTVTAAILCNIDDITLESSQPLSTVVAYTPPVYYFNGTNQVASILYTINNMSSSYNYFIWPMYYGNDGAWHIWENISVTANSGTKTTTLPSNAINHTLRVTLYSTQDGMTNLATGYGAYVNAVEEAELSGHVYNAETGEPLTDITIETYPNSIGSTHQDDTTDAQGVYNFSSIPAGVSTIVDIDDENYRITPYTFVPEADVHYILDLYALPEDGEEINSTGSNVLYGLLIDVESTEGIGSTITLSNSTWNTTATTNSTTGYYIFNNVPAAGNYSFSTSAAGYTTYSDTVLISGVTRYDAYMSPIFNIVMRAQDADDSSYISTFSGTIGNTTLATTNGNITFTNVEYGVYKVSASAASYTTSSQVSLIEEDTTITMSLYANDSTSLTGNSTIQGVVYNAQTGYNIPYLPVTLYQDGNTRYYVASGYGVFYFDNVLSDEEADLDIASSNYTCDGISITPGENQNYIINLYCYPEDEEELGFTGTNALYGSVLDSNTNNPMEGVSVSLSNATYSRTATTTATGYYYFDDIPKDGVYTLQTSGSGFSTVSENIAVSGVTAHNVYVTKVYNVNIKAQNSVTGAYLTTFSATLGSNSGSTTSGTVSFSSIAYNVYTASATATNYYTASQSVLVDGTENIILQLTPTSSGSYDSSVSGTVYNALSGASIPYVQVSSLQNGDYTYYTTSTSGYYTFPYIISGTAITLHVNDDDYEHTAVTFTPAASTAYTINLYCVPADEEDVESELGIDGDNALYGIITDSSTHNAISGVTVSLAGYGSTTTDSMGVYTFDDISSAGTYTLTASKTGYNTKSASVAISGTTRHDLELVQVYGITVKARDAESNDYVLNFTACVDDSCVTTTNGSAYFNNIEIGTYTVSASADDFYAGAQTITLESSSANVTIYLTPKSSAYYESHYSRFILMSPLGSRYSNIPVLVYYGTSTANGTVYTGTTGSDGSVTFKLIENTQYTIKFLGSGVSETWVGYPKDTEYWIIVGASSGAAIPEERASDQVLYGVSGNRINLASGRINASFVDNSGNSTLAELWINDLNGTNLYYFSTTANEYDWSQEVNATANATDYQVIFKITSPDFESGSMTVTKIISFINGVRIDFGFDEQWHYQLIGTLLIIAIASFFSLVNIHIGAILTTFAGWFNLWAGWYPTETSTILMLMLATLVAFVFYMRRGESIS